MEQYFWPVVGVLVYIGAVWWDNKLNMKQEDVMLSYESHSQDKLSNVKSYFPDETKGEDKK